MPCVQKNFSGYGFSLIEFLVSLAILSITLTLGIGDFASLRANLKMSCKVNALFHVIHEARHTALTRGSDITLCPAQNGQCLDTREWHQGWLMFANTDGDSPPRIDPGEPILTRGEPARGLRISANRNAFVLRPFGRRATNGTLIFCDLQGRTLSRAIAVSYTGKPRTKHSSARCAKPEE